MHPSLATIPTPPHLALWVPPVRNRSVGVRFELGQIAPEPVPPTPYSVLPLEPITSPYTPKDCLSCGHEFTPKAPNSLRCLPCAEAERNRKRAVWLAQQQHVTPSQKRATTMSIDAATRDRARRSAAAKRRQAA